MKRRLLWPLWSPRRLALCALAAFCLLLVLSARPGARRASVPGGPIAGSPPASSPNQPPPETGTTPGLGLRRLPAPAPSAPTTTTPSQAPPEQAAAAEAFVAAWARPQLAEPAWLAALAPLCSPDLAARLASVDPAMVPAHALTGPARGDDAQLEVPTDAGPVLVILAPGSLLVSDFTPA